MTAAKARSAPSRNFVREFSNKMAGRGGELWFFVRFLHPKPPAANNNAQTGENGV